MAYVMQSDGRRWRSVGLFKLPGGEGGEGVIELMLKYLDVKSFHALVQTSLIKQVSQISTGSAYLKTTCIEIYETYRDRIISKLNEKYIAEFPKGTPFICACETGRLEDVKMYLGTGAVDDVNMTGKRSNGFNHRTGLMLAVEKEHINVVKYLLSFPSIKISEVDNNDWNCLHFAAAYNRKTSETIKLLLNHEQCNTTKVINVKHRHGLTPLNCAEYSNRSKLQEELIQLLKKHGALRASEM